MSDNQNLIEKAQKWLTKQGYALEYRTAEIYKKHEIMFTRQGNYIIDAKENVPREIDVIADYNLQLKSGKLSIHHMIECKWSRDKPWIIFTDENTYMNPSASISQTISTETASAILWCAASDEELKKNFIFMSPYRSGFNGRQAFSDNDMVYRTIKSITSLSLSAKEKKDNWKKTLSDHLSHCDIYFPIIVIDGVLLESFYSNESDKMELKEVPFSRIHWKGSDHRPFTTTVDVVTIDGLKQYLDLWLRCSIKFVEKLDFYYSRISECMNQKSFSPIQQYVKCSRGIVGIPTVLQAIKFQYNINEDLDGSCC